MRGPPLPWVAILGAAVASPPPAPAFNATAAFARFLAVETWWLGRGAVPAPPWWTVTAFGNLSARAAPTPDVDTAPTPDVDALDRGNSKDVRRAATGPEADALATLMARMSAPDPDDRPTFAGALALLDRWNAPRQGS